LCVLSESESLAARRDRFYRTLLSALDESMKNIFGENTAKAVYYHLREGYLLKLEDIPTKPQTFAKAIKEIFGETGAEVIETLLVKDLCTKFRIKGQRKDIDRLVDCMHELKITCIEK